MEKLVEFLFGDPFRFFALVIVVCAVPLAITGFVKLKAHWVAYQLEEDAQHAARATSKLTVRVAAEYAPAEAEASHALRLDELAHQSALIKLAVAKGMGIVEFQAFAAASGMNEIAIAKMWAEVETTVAKTTQLNEAELRKKKEEYAVELDVRRQAAEIKRANEKTT